MELPSSTPELVESLRLDRIALMRDALLWQRWIRYAGLAIGVVLAIAFAPTSRAELLPRIALVGAAYLACVVVTAEWVRRRGLRHEHRIPAIIFTADIVTVASFTWLTGAPADALRMLIAAPLAVQLAVFYFGRGLGIYAAIVGGVCYLLAALVLPAQVAGARPSLGGALLTIGVYAFVSGSLVVAYGGFRHRMNQLRLFCRLVEEGAVS